MLSGWNVQGYNLNRVVAVRPAAGRTKVFYRGDPRNQFPGASVLANRVNWFLNRAQEQVIEKGYRKSGKT